MSSRQITGDNETINSEEEELFGKNNLSINSNNHDDNLPTLAKTGCSLEDHKNVQTILGKQDPTIHNLVELIFGPRSNISHLLEEKLEVSSENLLKNIGTFSLTSAYNLSKTQYLFNYLFAIEHCKTSLIDCC